MSQAIKQSLNESADDRCVQAVLDTYRAVLQMSPNEKAAFAAAIRTWREHNPYASPEQDAPAVATIICSAL
jgi:hypothetical protein